MTQQERIDGFIKAITSYGGDEYPSYDGFFTDENKSLYKQWLARQPKASDVTLHRGYTFDEQYIRLDLLSLGDIMTKDSLTQDDMPSFTTQQVRASMYMNEYGEITLDGSVRVLFVIRTAGKSFVDITNHSFYKEEKEYKCTDDVRLKVTGLGKRGGYWLINLEEV